MADTTFINQQTVIESDWLNDTNTVVYKAASGIPGATNRTAVSKLSDSVYSKDFGILDNGVTDQTSALVALLTTLKAQNFSGVLNISPNTKFLPQTVYSTQNVTGIRIKDYTGSLNWISGNYKQKFLLNFSFDLVNDDSQNTTGSTYHPVIGLWNTGSGTQNKSDSAAKRYATIAQVVGHSAAYNTPIVGMMQQFGRDNSSNIWRASFQNIIDHAIAMGDWNGKWFSNASFVIGEQVSNSTGAIYRATSTGTSGSTQPTGTGDSINDGGVTWTYVQPTSDPSVWTALTTYGVGALVLNRPNSSVDYKLYRCTVRGISAASAGPDGTGSSIVDGSCTWSYVQDGIDGQRTIWEINENGHMGIFGKPNTEVRFRMQATGQGVEHSLNNTTGRYQFFHEQNALNILDYSATTGLVLPFNSFRWVSKTGTAPTMPNSGAAKIANTSATNMSQIIPLVGVTNATLVLRFDNANTTLVHGTGVNNMVLRGNINVTPPSGSFLTLEYDSSFSGAWREFHRSF